MRQIREVGGPGSGLVWTDGGEADGWGGGRTLGWPKVALFVVTNHCVCEILHEH